MEYPIWAWAAFTVGVIFMLLLDLQVFHREAHEVRAREAAAWSLVWIAAGVLFGLFVWWERGGQAGLEYFTAYLIEKSLSLDNVFVWMVVFGYFALPPRYQHRVLFWGVVGAIVMRGLFIAAGVSLLKAFHWVVYVFGAILVVTGLRLAFKGEEEVLPEHNPILRVVRRFIPMTETYEGQAFFVRRAGRLMATPMLAVLVVVETTDIMFAVDSVPAVLAITREPFIVWTSNVAAILGLRALYFLISGVLRQFRYLHYGLAVVLIYVGGKMAASEFYKIPTLISLGVIAVIVGTAIVLSAVAEMRERAQAAQPVNPGPTHGHGKDG
ncbi:MAG: TerC family protein [Dehalococcoidia bacterium]|jgi:tellurite resistance protein TerC|nr:TerC family protein [Dehalococcoidia bacterium]